MTTTETNTTEQSGTPTGETTQPPAQAPETGPTHTTTNNADTGAAPQGGSTDTGDTGGDPKNWEAEAAKWKALSRKNEADKLKALAELEKLNTPSTGTTTSSNGTGTGNEEVRRLTEQVNALVAKQRENEHQALLARAAEAKHLTADQAKYLSGSTYEELLASADRIRADFGLPNPQDTQQQTAPGGARETHPPREHLRPGASGPDTDGFDDQKIVEQALRKTFGHH
ncbi:hypothetical protein [Streptomyces calidiresistens]|uniref:Scaffolding protein n=1 Tax=Streptomyces calidiresistens TaxID=1485586 RepID=A0A7W3T747_9ACTN|nr:hypothetical protein [Streptomyces calidiresistens]MBB0231961.1 hypothetical protein [Streptomyces calidiresistens]